MGGGRLPLWRLLRRHSVGRKEGRGYQSKHRFRPRKGNSFKKKAARRSDWLGIVRGSGLKTVLAGGGDLVVMYFTRWDSEYLIG